MKISMDCICRGSGKVYVLLKNVEIDASNIQVTAAKSEGTTIPSSIYPYESNKNQYVVVLPDLGTGDYDIQINDLSARCVYDVIKISFSTAKWASRLNYKLKNDLSHSIRNYDDKHDLDVASMRFHEFIEDGDEAILRCSVKLPQREDNKIAISCFDTSMNRIEIEPITTDDITIPLWFAPNKKRREIQYSVRIPNSTNRLIFTVEDDNHPSFNSFAVVDNEELDKLRILTTSKMKPISIDPSAYPNWLEQHKASSAILEKQSMVTFKEMPLFSIVVPLFNTPENLFREMVESVLIQSYANWELVLVNASPDNSALADIIEAAKIKDARIKVIELANNAGISKNTLAGTKEANGDFICFLDHDDTLEPSALYEYAHAINAENNTDLIYCDEDKLFVNGSYGDPFFKPDLSIDLLRSVNYICHFLAIRKTLFDSLEYGDEQYDGAQDHDLTLKAIEKARHVVHVAKILYHWRISENSTAGDPNSKLYAWDAGVKAVQAHLDRLGIAAKVYRGNDPFTYKVAYAVPESHPLVSIVIPTKDHPTVLDTCIKSIIERSTYDNYEIVIIENNSENQETFEYYSELEKSYPDTIRIEYWDAEFNFSKLMNFGASKAKGDYLLLLNNDTEVITPNWIENMLGICSRKEVGIVGARLFYSDNTLQHAGVGIGGIGAGHLGKDYPRGKWGYFNLCDRTQDLSAVTAACLMTKRAVFDEVGGFREELAVAFNDVDYCLKVRSHNYLVVYTPDTELYHYESLSRGYEISDEKKMRFHREYSLLNYLWPEYYVKGDPYININIVSGNLYYQI